MDPHDLTDVLVPVIRAPAINAINGERDYQEQKWGGDESQGKHTPLEFLVYIEDYTREALHVNSRRPDPEAREFSLHTLRKIGAMAIAALEQNGVRTRDEEGPRPVGYSE